MTHPSSLESPLLRAAGFRHGFFTRLGGVSTAPFDSLNTSPAGGDSPENVEENLTRIARALSVSPDALLLVTQVHGTRLLTLSPDTRRGSLAGQKADGLVAISGALACCVRTADCVPLLLADPKTGTVAAVHAGWRGVAGRISVAAVEALCGLGSVPGDMLAAIGPHIRVEAFEISESVADELEASAPGVGGIRRDLGPKPHGNLAALVTAQLVESGLRPESLDDLAVCTHANPSSFYSHRRDGAPSGRLLSAIRPGRVKEGCASGQPCS